MKDNAEILLVEDDMRDVELMKASLKSTGLEDRIVVVSDGAEALDYLFRRGPYSSRPVSNPAVVLLDIKMPKVDGIQVLREIKADSKLRTTPVVMLTSSREASDVKTCYGLGVNAYVVKPMQFNEFISAIQHIGIFWAKVNEPAP